MEIINFKSKNVNNAIFCNGIGDRLIVWFDGAFGQQPELYSLGKLIKNNTIDNKYPILMPRASYGHNGQNITSDELNQLIDITGYKEVSIVGWSNGSDATCLQVRAQPTKFKRVVLISNYTNQWKNCANEINSQVCILLGAREKAAASNRTWPIVEQLKDCKLYRVQPYDHMIGEKIWTDQNYFVLDWLAGKTDDIQIAPKIINDIVKQKKNSYKNITPLNIKE